MKAPVLQLCNTKYTPGNLLMLLLWLIAVVGAVLFFFSDDNGLAVVVGLSSFAFIVVLIWALVRKRPYSADLQDMDFVLTHRVSFGVAFSILVAGIGALFLIGMVIGPAVSIILVSAFLGFGLVVSWRSQLSKRIVVTGILVGLLVGLGIIFLGNGDLVWAVFNLATLPLTFMSGALLIRRSGLAQSRLLQGDYSGAVRGFIWACAIAVPAALLNLLGGIQGGDSWIEYWWQPLYALVPGIAEETWARLFLTTLFYALLRPAANLHPRRVIFFSILFGALVHGFGHTGIDPLGLVIGSVLYGVPAGLLFVKYDFEHAVGYHFLIDFVRYAAALLSL